MAFNFEMEKHCERYESKLKWTINNIWVKPPCLESELFFPIPDSSGWAILLNFQEKDQWEIQIKSFDRTKKYSIVRVTGSVDFNNPLNSKSITLPMDSIVKHNQINQIFHINEDFYDYLCDKILMGDLLILEFHLNVTTSFNKNTSCEINNLKETTSSNEKNLTPILEKIYKRNSYTDVDFSFDKKTIRAHKAVLTVASPVFEKMFEHDTLENKTNSVSIEDIDADVFECFLEFIYSRKVNENIKKDLDSLLSLYEVSDKYEVLDLQKFCANILLSDFLNVKSVCKILKLADSHDDIATKNVLFQFLKQNFSEVVKTEEWTSLTSENITLAANVVALIASQIN